MFKKLSLIFIAVLGFVAASCNKNGDEPKATITQQSFSDCISLVTANGVTTGYEGLGFELYLNYTSRKADVTVIGLRFPNGTSLPSFTLKDIPFGYDSDSKLIVKADKVKPQVVGMSDLPDFKDFEMVVYDRFVLSNESEKVYYPAFCVSFEVNEYDVLSTFNAHLIYGRTESLSPDNTGYTTLDPNYQVLINPATNTLTIGMAQTRFVEAMPALDIIIRDVPFTVDGDELKFSVSKIVPYIGDAPQEDYALTDLQGEFDPADGLKMTFKCNPPRMGEYSVKVTAEFTNFGPVS